MKKLTKGQLLELFASEGFVLLPQEASVVKLAAGCFEKCRVDTVMMRPLGKWEKRMVNYIRRLEELRDGGRLPPFHLEYVSVLPPGEAEPVLRFLMPSGAVLKIC